MAWSGTPFTVFDGAVMINVPDGPEQMFIDAGGDFLPGPAGPDGVDLGPGMKPLVGDFDGDLVADDVFWYGAGDKPDQLWYFRPIGCLDQGYGGLPLPDGCGEPVTDRARIRYWR